MRQMMVLTAKSGNYNVTVLKVPATLEFGTTFHV